MVSRSFLLRVPGTMPKTLHCWRAWREVKGGWLVLSVRVIGASSSMSQSSMVGRCTMSSSGVALMVCKKRRDCDDGKAHYVAKTG